MVAFPPWLSELFVGASASKLLSLSSIRAVSPEAKFSSPSSILLRPMPTFCLFGPSFIFWRFALSTITVGALAKESIDITLKSSKLLFIVRFLSRIVGALMTDPASV